MALTKLLASASPALASKAVTDTTIEASATADIVAGENPAAFGATFIIGDTPLRLLHCTYAAVAAIPAPTKAARGSDGPEAASSTAVSCWSRRGCPSSSWPL